MSRWEQSAGITVPSRAFTRTKSVAHGLQTGEKVYRGKRPMTFDVFESLCVKSMALNDGGYAHLFLDRFGKSLAALVCGGNSKAKKDIGTHSIRKGAATFVSSGSTGGPSIISVCLRFGWALRNVMERYFRYEAAGDQFTGRCVAGLSLNSADFAVLPPHFSGGNDLVVGQAVQIMFPSLCSEIHLVPILQLILASLVYHRNFLIGSLPPHHALLSTSLFTNPDLFAKSSIASALSSIQQSNCAMSPAQQLQIDSQPLVYEPFHWGGKFHKLPQNFVFPSVDAATAWKLWWRGNIREKVLPYRKIDTQDLATRAARNMFYEWKFVLEKLTDHFVSVSGRNMALNPSEQEVSTSFDTARGLFDQFCGETSAKRVRRDGQLKITTLVRLLRQLEPSKTPRVFKKRKRSEQRAGSQSTTML
ncbi:hypothetical protein H257_09574 [Aphanomyces astaci]|uniref:Uncharacterized protein n=2 Tax=Aphanomyces astaci TaxID=112090 RepID=W4GA96_APHAT|nr:hypothetical protein H257_09574 [Aphanomyces astaci]ETV76575.1 hypothetical protein H257_09574 [Aphanomyces astaci]|eukprot:XP_009834120.1 hypothetical protein H257_09574 [Aphanomyces astaci]